MYRISPFVTRFTYALSLGALLATLWVNLSPASYYDMIEWLLVDFTLPAWIWAGSVTLTPLAITTDLLMSLFFFYLGKELWEALTLERGSLSGKRLIIPLGLAVGAMAGAAMAWILFSNFFETAEEASFGTGWPVSLGGATLFVYLFGRHVFNPRSRALHFALLIAILMDILSLVVLGFTNPNLYSSPKLFWLILPLMTVICLGRWHGRQAPAPKSERIRRKRQRLWPYGLAAALSWFGVAASGLPAALGLLPLIPFVLPSGRSFGLFAEAEGLLHDPLNRLSQLISWPLVAVLFLFGLMHGGLDLQGFTVTTWITLASLWIGKPLGMMVAGVILAVLGIRARAQLPFSSKLGIMALCSMSFTVPIIAITAALPGGAMTEAARLGFALSLIAGPLTILISRLFFSDKRLQKPSGQR